VTDLFDEGDAILFMKVGQHANEELAHIIDRKRREIEEAGFAMWGYGGNTCHPTTMVQPFVKDHISLSQPILLCMQPMTSKHFAEQVRATEYSVDGLSWQRMPESINVLGSRYALCIKDLRETDASLFLDDTQVALGRSKGKAGSEYIRGHVDKACLEIVGASRSSSPTPIGLVAELVDPYAVLLRNQ
jgi:hypothetical protein